jgi:hypothetical protein
MRAHLEDVIERSRRLRVESEKIAAQARELEERIKAMDESGGRATPEDGEAGRVGADGKAKSAGA